MQEKTAALLEKIAQARGEKSPFTIILSDPPGNRAIISEKAEKTQLDVSLENC
jgi:zinc finger protein